MYRIFQNFLLVTVLAFIGDNLAAQAIIDSLPASINPELMNIFESKPPKEYSIAGITVNGNVAFDQNLIISISGLAMRRCHAAILMKRRRSTSGEAHGMAC